MKWWFSIGGILIVVVFGAMALMGENGALEIFRLKRYLTGLNEEIQALELKQNDLKEEIAKLGEPSHVEFLAREQLGLMRPNEIFILLDPSSEQ